MLTLLKLALVFAGLLLLLRRRVHMGLAMLAAAVALLPVFGLAPDRFVQIVLASLTARPTIELALAILLIMLLEGLLRESGLMRCLVDCLLGSVRDSRLMLALLPALIGFLPSPAWARFLAPVVEEMSVGSASHQTRKAFTTYWYQHVTAYVSPLFPALVLAAHLLEVSLASIIVALVPVALVALLFGAPFAFAGMSGQSPKAVTTGNRLESFRGLLRGIAPVALVVALVLFGVEVSIALALVVMGLAALFRYSPRRVYGIGRRTVSLAQVGTVVAIMVFKDVLVGTGALAEIPLALAAFSLPPLAIVLAVSFLAGMLTGSTNTSIAMAVPMLAGVASQVSPALVALVFVFGFSGLMLAPAHPCLGLTLQHFRASFGPVQRMVLGPQLGLMAVALVLYQVLPTWGG
jgi:uncharacterized protein